MSLRQTYSTILALYCLVAGLVGCARITANEDPFDDLPQLPLARMADETIVLEITLVHVPQSETWDQEVWSEIDEQHLPPELRQQIASNGFRAGIVGMQLPEGLRKQLDARRLGARGVLANLNPGEEHHTGARRIQLRDGNRSDVVTRSPQKSLVVLVDDRGDLVGKTFKNAQPTFTVKANRMADGRARVELTPEIRFGPTRQRWASGEGVFRMESGQDRRTFDELGVDAVLSAGQTLIVAATGPARSLGGTFFASKVDGQREKALLIRLSETGYEDIYAVPEFDSPLVQVVSDERIKEGIRFEKPAQPGGEISMRPVSVLNDEDSRGNFEPADRLGMDGLSLTTPLD